MHNSYLIERVTVRGRLGEQAKNKTFMASLYYYSKLVWLSSYSALSPVHFNLSSLFSKGQNPTGFFCPSSPKKGDVKHFALYKLPKTNSLP